MRFEPRLLKPDDLTDVKLDELLATTMLRDDESGLPADLAELAGQLKADSAFLGATYPATLRAPNEPTRAPSVSDGRTELAAPPAMNVAPPQPTARPYWLAGTTLAAMVAVGVAWWLTRPSDTPPLAVQPPVPITSIVANETPERSPLEVAMKAREAAMGLDEESLPTSEVSSPATLRDLTGPELEGLLDLLEGQSQGKPKLSI
jgi:hypothetical protein